MSDDEQIVKIVEAEVVPDQDLVRTEGRVIAYRPNVLRAVEGYLQEKFGRPHPIPRGEKGPRIKGWQDEKTVFAIGAWDEDDNVGTALTGDLVDVDLDSVEAVACARDFLPPTQRIHGRPGKPDSHFWYRVPALDSHVFKDIKRPTADGKTRVDTFCEIRAGAGHQTVLPPSIHPSGDVLKWSIDREPGQPDAKELWRTVTYVGTVCLLARSWPGGNRHFAALHLAGFLCARKVDDQVILKIVRWAARLAGDEEVEDRERAARTTIEEFKAGGKTSGGPALAEIIGNESLQRLQEWYGGNSSIHDRLVEEMNEKRFMTRLGKDTVYGLELKDEVVFQAARALFEEFSNEKIQIGEKKAGPDKGQKITKTRFEIWREHPDKRRYSRVVFAPPPLEFAQHEYNLWKGFSFEALLPPAGDPARLSRDALREWADRECKPKCERYLNLIGEVICSGNQEYFDYLVDRWMAFTVQCPGVPAEVAVALKGEMGTGKGTFAREFGRLFGRHFIHLDRTEQMAGKFNAAISGKALVFADEAFFAGDKKDLGSLKRLITEPTLAIERKGFDVVQEANCVHLIMATNNEHAHQAAMKERRFFTVHVSDKQLQRIEYFDPIIEEMRNGGRQALLSYLMTRVVTHNDVRRVPLTDELRVQQEHSLSYELQWWKENLYYGQIGDETWPTEIGGRQIHEDYIRWCDTMKVNRRVSEIEMCRSILKGYLLDERRRIVDGKKRSLRSVLPLDEARKLFDQRAGTTSPWPTDDLPAPERKPKEPLPF